MFCPNCGLEIVDSFNFCPKCGSNTSPAVKAIVNANLSDSAENDHKRISQDTFQGDSQVKPVEVPKESWTNYLIRVSAIILIMKILFGVFSIWFSDKCSEAYKIKHITETLTIFAFFVFLICLSYFRGSSAAKSVDLPREVQMNPTPESARRVPEIATTKQGEKEIARDLEEHYYSKNPTTDKDQ